MEYRDINQISPADRSAQLWLNVDDVLERLPLGRSTLWKMIKEGTFPKPYQWRKRPLWTQADLKDFINGCVQGTEQTKVEKTPITWDGVLGLLKSKTSGLTNKQIAFLLDADETDTTNLTRLMAKAGVINLFKPISNHNGSPNFYTYADSVGNT